MAEPTSVATATLIMAGCAIATAISLFTIGIGIGKEVYDRFAHGTVDVYDALATVWGGVVMLGWIEIARGYA